jgi:hypothetical protein
MKPEELCLDLTALDLERAVLRAVADKYGVDLRHYAPDATLEWWTPSGGDKLQATVVLTLKG